MRFSSKRMPTSPKFENLVGRRFSLLTVRGFAGMRSARAYWKCQCDCGNDTVAASNHLKRGSVQSCGCLLSARKVDLTGRKFTRWTVLGPGKRDRHWICRCRCGNEEEVYASSLTDKLSRSCGCIRDEVSAKNMRALQKRMRAEGRGSRTTHGMAYSAEHRAWSKAKGRCHCPTDAGHSEYGGRGIQMCERWRNSFEAFLHDVGMRPSSEHSLDRIDVNKGYEPGNVRWATRIEQANNTRRKRIENFSEADLLAELKRRRIR